MIRRFLTWIKNGFKSFLGAVVMIPAKVVGTVADLLTDASLWLYKGTPKYNHVAEGLSITHIDIADHYASVIDYGDVISELISEEVSEEIKEEFKEAVDDCTSCENCTCEEKQHDHSSVEAEGVNLDSTPDLQPILT